MIVSVGVAGKGLVEKPVQPLRCRVAPAVQGHREDVVIDWQVRERGATAEEGCRGCRPAFANPGWQAAEGGRGSQARERTFLRE